jgi:hypothetical protein
VGGIDPEIVQDAAGGRAGVMGQAEQQVRSGTGTDRAVRQPPCPGDRLLGLPVPDDAALLAVGPVIIAGSNSRVLAWRTLSRVTPSRYKTFAAAPACYLSEDLPGAMRQGPAVRSGLWRPAAWASG